MIAEKDQITIFIEVKYRASDAYGLPEESITRSKLQKLKKTIEYYCLQHSISFEKIQFDVITILRGEK
ncbi:MAG: YraN family protein [Candidatus Peribacteria bacterium]|nr:MAG: YraN family protein [Candidatus Peribacteria bacterium]